MHPLEALDVAEKCSRAERATVKATPSPCTTHLLPFSLDALGEAVLANPVFP